MENQKDNSYWLCKLQPPFLQRPHHVQTEAKDFRNDHTALI